MTRVLLLAVLAGGLAVVPGAVTARQDDKKTPPAVPADPAAKLVGLLNNEQFRYGGDLTQAPLSDVLRDLSKTFDITFVIDPTAFENPTQVGDAKATALAAARLEGLTFGRFLDVYLRALPIPEQATYLVRNDLIEITSREKAIQQTGVPDALASAQGDGDDFNARRLMAQQREPLVCVVADDRPVAELVKELARAYNLSLVIDLEAKVALGQAPATARLFNVPAETALELLAGQADLQVVRKGNAFRITAGAGAQ